MRRFLPVVLLFVFAASVFSAEAPLSDLERTANEVLSNPDNVARRAEIAPVFQLAERYASIGHTNQAITYYTKALEHYPWNLEAQLALAELLKGTGDTNDARQKADLVWTYAETDKLLSHAARLLDIPFVNELPANEPPPADPYALILVAYEGADTWLTLSLRDDLSKILGIPVVLRPVKLQIPAPGRNPLHLRAEELRKRIALARDDPRFLASLVVLGLSTNALTSDEAVFVFSEKLLDGASDKEPVKRFREDLAFLRRMGPQWDAKVLLDQLGNSVHAQAGAGMGYLGITTIDLYANDSRYVFGLAALGHNCGIFSYRRYTSDVLDVSPNRQRLKERSLKQALSSIGLMFGLPRCTDPTCARAYVNSLEEHDAKQLKLCSQCLGLFSKRFAKPAN